MNFESLNFNQKIDFLSDAKVKKALNDGKIDDSEKAIFEKHGVNDISDSDISEIENSYLELETYIENNKKAESSRPFRFSLHYYILYNFYSSTSSTALPFAASRIFCSISPLISGFSFKYARNFSLPCAILVPS